MRKHKKLLIAAVVLLVLIPGLLLALPWGARMAAVAALEAQGVQAQIEDVDLNLFTGRLLVIGAQGKAASGEGFRVDYALVEMRYLPLFDKRIHLSRLELIGTQLDVVRSGDNVISVAGIVPAPTETSDEPSGWGFGLDQAAVADTELRYRDELLDETLVVNATSVSDVATWAPGQAISFSALGALQGSELRINGSVQPFGETISVNLQVNAQALPLAMLGSYLAQPLEGAMDTDVSVGLVYTAKEGVKAAVQGDARLASLKVMLQQQGYDVSAEAVNWEGALDIGVPSDAEAPLSVSGNSSLVVDGLNLAGRGGAGTLLSAGKLEAGEIQVTSLDDIQAGSVAGRDLKALQSGEEPALASLSALKADRLSLSQLQKLTIGRVGLSGLQGRLERDAEGAWNYQAWLPPGQAQEAPGESSDESAGRAFAVAVDELELADGSQVTVADAGVKPAFETELQEVRLSLKNLDMAQPAQASPLSLSAKVGRYGQLQLDGTVKPFAENPEADIKGELRNANLVPLSGFTRQIVSHRISQGTVTSDIRIKMAGGEIDALFDLVLNKLKVAAVKGRKQDFEAETGMPLSTALSLMRDRDDNVRLKVPITGDVANPDVNIDRIIQKALFKAVQMGVLSFYSPLGVVMAADKLVQFATALRFNPVIFEPGSVLLGKEQATYIENMAGLLAGRPQVQVSVCGYAVPADREAVAQQVAEQSTRFFGLFKPDPDAEEVPEDALREVARKRAELVADFLVARDVGKDQVILCDPAVENDGDGQPRVEVSM